METLCSFVMDHRIQSAITYIKEHPEKQFSLDELAKVAHLSPTYFHQLFKSATGYTPRKYVELSKLELAFTLLFQEDVPIQDIAIKLGYSDYETFSRAYKRHYKISPGDLRLIFQQLKENISIEINPIMAHSDNEEDLVEKLQEKVVSISGLEEVKAFVVSPNEHSGTVKPRRINDKYSISFDAELSEKLYKKTES